MQFMDFFNGEFLFIKSEIKSLSNLWNFYLAIVNTKRRHIFLEAKDVKQLLCPLKFLRRVNTSWFFGFVVI